MAFPIRAEIDTGDHFGLLITLRKHNSYALVILRDAFQCIGWAGIVVHIAFAVIDGAFLHDLLYFRLRDLTALHPASGMLGIFNVGYPSVEPMIAIDTGRGIGRFFAGGSGFCLACIALLYEEENGTQYKYDDIRNPFPVQCQTFGRM